MNAPTPIATPGLSPEQLAALRLNAGNHDSPESGHCLLEVVSLFAGELSPR